MHRWMAGLALFPLLGGEALALSCMQPSAESVFAYHNDRPDEYVMAVGMVSPTDPLPVFNPKTLAYEPDGPIRATFEGRLAEQTGFDRRASLPISIERNCFDDICGFLPLRSPAVVFLANEGNGYVLRTDYCSSTLLPEPTDADLATLIDCLNGAECSAGN